MVCNRDERRIFLGRVLKLSATCNIIAVIGVVIGSIPYSASFTSIFLRILRLSLKVV